MPGGAGAARAGEHAAEGIIAKAAKDFLRDAIGPAGRDGIAATGRQAIPAGADDAVRTLGRDAMNASRHFENQTAQDFAREFPELNHGVNPGFRTGRPEFTQNCQSCVAAVDRSLDGQATRASARSLNAARDAFEPDPHFTWPSGVQQAIGHHAPLRTATGYQDIGRELIEAGPGSRGIVHGMRLAADGSYESGHVFNVVNKDGVLHFIDGQTGAYAYLEDFQGFQFMRTR